MGSGVLIADADAGRATELARACEKRGLRARCAPHGPAALEAALSEVPELVVAARGLPIIDAARLAQIARGNPRTQAVPFLFLGVPPGEGETSSLDERLPHDAGVEAVARRAEAILTGRSPGAETTHGGGEAHETAGELAQVSLVDVLERLHLNGRSGTLDVTRRPSAGPEQHGRVDLREGNVVQAQLGSVEGEKALFRLLGWSEGRFVFRPGPVEPTPRITASTRALLLEGVRHADAWKRAGSRIPSLDAEVHLRVSSGELPSAVQPLTQEVLLLLEIYSRVRDIVDHCTYPDHQVLRTLHALIERGVAELRPCAERPDPRLFSAPQLRRLREWMGHHGAGGPGSGDAKLLLLTSSSEGTREFLRRFGRLPAVDISDACEARTPSRGDFLPVARIAVSEEIAIELLHLPADAACEPLWRLAAHRALGILLVLRGTGEEARRLLEDCRGTLRQLPRTRLFHGVLLEDDQIPDPRGIREALGLDREANLAALAAGDDEVSVAALRALLASVIP